MANKVKIEVMDQAGKACDTSFFVSTAIHDPADSGITAIADAMRALIVGGTAQIDVEVEDTGVSPGVATNSGYNAADKMRFLLHSDSDGAPVVIDIPAPGYQDGLANNLFNADGSVNQGSPKVADLITFLNANALDTNGNSCTFVRGMRVRSKGLKTAH
jgi:hypothetical protein